MEEIKIMKRNFLFAAALVLSVGALASCGDTTSSATSVEGSVTPTSEVAKVSGTATEYGIVNAYCVTSVNIVVEDNLTTDVTIDETFTPSDWALVDADEVAGQTIDTITVTAEDHSGNPTDFTYAKYIEVDGAVYTGAAVEAEEVKSSQIVNYSNDDCDDLFAYISENAEWYFNVVKDEKISVVADAEGTAFETPYTLGTIDKYKTNFKADEDNTYWPVSDWAPLGWKGNIAKIEAGLTGLDLSTAPEVTLDETTKVFSFAGIETGATMTGTPVYVTLATAAYATLVD